MAMRIIKKVNYILIVFLFSLKFIDIFLTFQLLNLGGIELNPLGFNWFSITLSIGSIILLTFINIKFENKRILEGLLFILVFGITLNLMVVIKNGVIFI